MTAKQHLKMMKLPSTSSEWCAATGATQRDASEVIFGLLPVSDGITESFSFCCVSRLQLDVCDRVPVACEVQDLGSENHWLKQNVKFLGSDTAMCH